MNARLSDYDIDSLRRYATELERRLIDTQRVSGVGSWELELATDQLYWSNEIYHVFGIETSVSPTVELFFSLIHPDDLSIMQAAFTLCMTAFTPYAIDVRALRPNGEMLRIEARGEAVVDGQGQLYPRDGDDAGCHGTLRGRSSVAGQRGAQSCVAQRPS